MRFLFIVLLFGLLSGSYAASVSTFQHPTKKSWGSAKGVHCIIGGKWYMVSPNIASICNKYPKCRCEHLGDMVW